MKKFLFAALLVLFTTSVLTAQDKGVTFQSGTLKSLLAAADKADRYLFVDVYTTWCGPCKYMANTIFPQASVGEYFNKTFINAKFDAEKGEGIQVAKTYGVRAYPTFLILDATGKEVGRIVGGGDATEFVKMAKETLAKIK